MVLIKILCPGCGSERIHKRGHSKDGNLRINCLDCQDKGKRSYYTVNINTGKVIEDISKDKSKDKKLMKLLKKDSYTIEYLSDSTGLFPNEVRRKIEELEQDKFNIQYTDNKVILAKQVPTGNKTKLNIDYWKGGRIKLGLIADTHLCSTFERMEALNLIYDIFADEKIEVVYHGGNYIDGECKFNQYHLHTRGVTPQVEYFVNNYPKRAGILTKFVAGDDHEGWYIQRERLNIGEYTQMKAEKAGRKDLEYIGYVEADIYFEGIKGGSWMRVMHGGGGTAYALECSDIKITGNKFLGNTTGIRVEMSDFDISNNTFEGVTVSGSVVAAELGHVVNNNFKTYAFNYTASLLATNSHNHFGNMGTGDTLDVTVTYDPPSLATTEGAVSGAFTITNAELGDIVDVKPPYDTQGVAVYGFVSALDTVKISLVNCTGGAIDLASSGSWKLKLRKYQQ